MPEASDAGAIASGPALREAKQQLRVRMTALRDALDPEFRASASSRIVAGIAALQGFARARCVLVTFPFRSEWDTRPLVDLALARGASIVAPRVDPVARVLELRRVGDVVRDVAPSAMGIPEPTAECPTVPAGAIDCVIVPGLAFDLRGGRLGYGGGYYDRLVPGIDPRAPRIAGTFEAQLVDDVPSASHDLRVDWIVTERRSIAVRVA